MRKKHLGPEIWRETLKTVENEKCTLYDIEYAEKNLKIMENEKHTH